MSSCGWWLRHRPGSEDVTGAVTWVSVQSTLVFWFNKNCASRGPWGRRHRGTRDPARSHTRPGECRSVHKSAKMASRHHFGAFVYTVATREGRARGRGDAGVYTDWRKWPLSAVLGHSCTLLRLARVMRAAVGTQECTQIGKMASRGCFGSIVYTVATREGHARVAPPLGWRLCRDSNPHKPRGARYGDWTTSTGDPSAQGSVAFGSSGASGASRDAPGSLSGPYRTTSTTFSHRTYPAHMRARRTIVETLLSTLNLMSSQTPR